MSAQPLPQERYASSFARTLEHVKRHVKCIDEADLLTGPAGTRDGLRRSGDKWVGLCPLPDHDEKTPSFTVYADDERGWWCFGCNRGGDVLDLHQLAHGLSEKWEALVSLAVERNIELPVGGARSEKWHEATHRKTQYEKARYRILGKVLMRRLFRTQILPHIEAIENDHERSVELKRAWDEWQDELYWPRLAEEVVSHER